MITRMVDQMEEMSGRMKVLEELIKKEEGEGSNSKRGSEDESDSDD